MDTFAQFLHKRGLSKDMLSPKELDGLKKQHRRIYKREWQRQKDKEGSRIQIPFTHPERKQLEKAAKRHGIALTTFANKAIFAYLNQVFICPALDKKIQHKLHVDLVRFGTLANQMAYLANRRGMFLPQEIEVMLNQCQLMQEAVRKAFEEPKNLNRLIIESILQHPECKNSLLNAILNPKQFDY